MASKPLGVRVPRESVNDETVNLGAWRAEEGQKVEADQVVVETPSSPSPPPNA